MKKPNTHEPVFNIPPVVQALCLLNLGIFLFIYFFPQLMTDDVVYTLSFVPGRYTGAVPLDIAAFTSTITHMFIHANWLHLLINTSMLLAFGAGLERTLGARRMLLIYFATGLCGAGLHTLLDPSSTTPMIGASGAISGLFGGILMMMHGTGMTKLWPAVLAWMSISIFFGIFGMPGEANPIAWDAHIGGFIGGMLLYRPVLRLRI